MDPEKRYPILSSLLKHFCKRQRTTLALVTAAITMTGQARSMAIATTMQTWLHVQLGSAWNRFYRLLRNRRIDDTKLVAALAEQLCRGRNRHLVIPIDWTEWSHDMRILVASVVVGKRGIPLFVQAFRQKVWRRSQNSRENTFLRVLAWCLRQAAVHATILCDRGFRRVSWVKLLQELQLDFVVRLMSDVLVEIEPGLQVALHDILLEPGRVLDLGPVPLRSDGAATVRVIGYWAPDAHEPWWLATSQTTSARRVLSFYDRRMTVEETLRDTKGCRFGVKLAWTQFQDPDDLARFLLLLGVAVLIWTLVGVDAARRDRSLRLVCRSKGPRQSHVTIGLRIVIAGGSHPPLRPGSIARLLEDPAFRRVAGAVVGGK